MSPSRDTNGVVIGVSTRVQLGLLIAAGGALLSAALAWERLDSRVARIEEKISDFVDEMRRARAEAWTHEEQAHFVDVLESANPGVRVPRINRGG